MTWDQQCFFFMISCNRLMALVLRRGVKQPYTILFLPNHRLHFISSKAVAGPSEAPTEQASLGERPVMTDTLALVRKLEAHDMSTQQAEAITSAITEVLNGSLGTVAQSFATKEEMLNSQAVREAALSKIKAEIQSSQEKHFATLHNETEKLHADIDKLRSEFRYEIDKITAAQRLDLSLERGRIRDQLATQNEETQNLTNKLDKEIHALRTQVEAAKYDVTKYCIGTIVSVTAVGLGLLRILI